MKSSFSLFGERIKHRLLNAYPESDEWECECFCENQEYFVHTTVWDTDSDKANINMELEISSFFREI